MNISKELANAILNYLATKPYAEVFRLISELSKQAGEIKEEVKEEEKTDESSPDKE